MTAVRVEVVPGYTDQAEFERDLAALKVLASRIITPPWDNTPTIEERLVADLSTAARHAIFGEWEGLA